MSAVMASNPSSGQYSVCFTAVPDIPHISSGDDVAQLLFDASNAAGLQIAEGDIFVVAHKIISKAEGCLRNLSEVHPSDRAFEVANVTGKDPRLVELILRESTQISRMKPGLLIVRHRLGFTSANAGIDRSNVFQEEGDETVLLLPEDPDASASKLQERLRDLTGSNVGIVIADSHGRPFRLGTVGVAIGVAGAPALWDRRGERDIFDYELQHTDVGTADEIAAAASLIMGQAAEGTPVVHIRGLRLPDVRGRARDLVRPRQDDLYQ
jgi:coenzyme F420-0:L-glutamate ligase/coenzyme F420-1:gamma-L-glutamate ligase